MSASRDIENELVRLRALPGAEPFLCRLEGLAPGIESYRRGVAVYVAAVALGAVREIDGDTPPSDAEVAASPVLTRLFNFQSTQRGLLTANAEDVRMMARALQSFADVAQAAVLERDERALVLIDMAAGFATHFFREGISADGRRTLRQNVRGFYLNVMSKLARRTP